jgi:hypothetical protein
LTTLKILTAGVLLAGSACLVDLQVAQADPLVPPTPAEIKFLDDLHRAFPGTHDPAAFHSDGVLLDTGWLACEKRKVGLVGFQATGVSPIITQIAFIDLCPN